MTRRITLLDLVFAGFSVCMLLEMWRSSATGMTIPYHFIFVSFALVYGFRGWGRSASIAILTGLTVATGLVFLHAFQHDEVQLDELAEVPLMPLILSFMVFHGLRASAARRRVEELAALEAGRSDRQREFLRDTSHAIRTPVTIARGHVELMRMATANGQIREDAGEVVHQLDRINALAGRLLAIEQLETIDEPTQERVDVADFLTTNYRRWITAAPRRWALDVRPVGVVQVDSHRLTEALDALVENALRFTKDCDVVRLGCHLDGGFAVIEVADSGPGIPSEDRERVFDRFFHRHPRGEEPGTGLGLALVAAVAGAHAGDVAALAAPEGGALLRLRLPVVAALPGEQAGPPATEQLLPAVSPLV